MKPKKNKPASLDDMIRELAERGRDPRKRRKIVVRTDGFGHSWSKLE